jgi:hypothetical protein
MFNAFQCNCFNLVDTCNIALILFLKFYVTKFRIPLHPLSHNVTLCQPPLPPLRCDVIYECPLILHQFLNILHNIQQIYGDFSWLENSFRHSGYFFLLLLKILYIKLCLSYNKISWSLIPRVFLKHQ